MRRAALLSMALACPALAACLELADSVPADGGAGASGAGSGGGGTGGSGWVDAASGGDAGVGGGLVPFGSSDFSSEHSGDSVANASSIDFTANIPASTKFLLACAHWRDNDTLLTYPGGMTVAGSPMAAVDAAAVGIGSNKQAGTQCFSLEDPATGKQTVTFALQSSAHSYDYLRVSTFYFFRPARIDSHAVDSHTAGNSHGQSIVTNEPAAVLAIYTKYYAQPCSTTGFIELFDEPGFGGDAEQYAAILVQTTAGAADWMVALYGNASWGGSQLVAIVPK